MIVGLSSGKFLQLAAHNCLAITPPFHNESTVTAGAVALPSATIQAECRIVEEGGLVWAVPIDLSLHDPFSVVVLRADWSKLRVHTVFTLGGYPMKKLMVVLIVAAIALGLVAFDGPKDRDDPPGNGGSVLSATLTGADEIPGPGDADGTGRARIRINSDAGRVCFRIKVANITLPAAAAHIHIGSAGFAGPVVVNLAPPDASGLSTGCASDLDPGLLDLIQSRPRIFYVNVHTSDFPAGAVRGQLSQ
jgi:hypothetical protein